MSIDAEIIAAARVTFSAAEVDISTFTLRDKYAESAAGLWYSLNYRTPDGRWECGGVRRNKEALLILAKRGPLVIDRPERPERHALGGTLNAAWTEIRRAKQNAAGR